MRRFYLFFLVGGWVALNREMVMAFYQRWFWLSVAVFAASFLLMLDGVSGDVRLIVIGLASLPALHQLVRLAWFEKDRLLLFLGGYSFVIYLFNTIFIGLAKGLWLKFLAFGGGAFFPALLVLLVAGVLGPVLLKRHVLSRWPWADRLTS